MDARRDVEREGIGHVGDDERSVRLERVVAGGERLAVEAYRDERQFLAIEAQRRSGGRRLGIAAQLEIRFDESLGVAELEIERDLIDQKIGRAVIGEAGRKRRLVERGVGHDNGTIGGVM